MVRKQEGKKEERTKHISSIGASIWLVVKRRREANFQDHHRTQLYQRRQVVAIKEDKAKKGKI